MSRKKVNRFFPSCLFIGTITQFFNGFKIRIFGAKSIIYLHKISSKYLRDQKLFFSKAAGDPSLTLAALPQYHSPI